MLLFCSSSTAPTAQQTAAGDLCNTATSPGQRLSMKTRWTLTSPPLCMWCLHASASENTQQEATLPTPKATREIGTSKQWHHTPGEWIQLFFSYSYSFQSLLRTSSNKLPLPAQEIHLKEHQVTAALNKMTHLSPCPSLICAHILQQKPVNALCPESACVDEQKNRNTRRLRFSICPKTCFGMPRPCLSPPILMENVMAYVQS